MFHPTRRTLLTAAAAAALLPPAALRANPNAAASRTITWDDLVPKHWDPSKEFQALGMIGAVPEGSAREQELMAKMREIFDKAPTRPELRGTRVRLPGYVVPLESTAGAVREFLLVPYFGACIHTPPPPANQIVHVRLAKAQPLRTMDAIWATGTLNTARSDTPMGTSGYTMDGAVSIEPYVRR
jgi:hypothetical protein